MILVYFIFKMAIDYCLVYDNYDSNYIYKKAKNCYYQNFMIIIK